MTETSSVTKQVETARHHTSWIESGPANGPLMIFIHGWPEIGLLWRAQVEHFAAAGWRCVAPDMRGYGGSSAPTYSGAYALRELVADMAELHDALGGEPAVWVGHDWGSPVVWGMVTHHPERCRAVANLCVPHIARGFALPNIVPLVDRELYPEQDYPVGQWDYWLLHREHFGRTVRVFEADVRATFSASYRSGSPKAVGKPAMSADMRAKGGWFGPAGPVPEMPRDEALMPQDMFDALVAAFERTGFGGADAWYLNDAANTAYAAEAPAFGRIALPVLFLHAEWDTVCDTVHSRLADPMREDCTDLTEVTIAGGHMLMLERPGEVNGAITNWLKAKGLTISD